MCGQTIRLHTLQVLLLASLRVGLHLNYWMRVPAPVRKVMFGLWDAYATRFVDKIPPLSKETEIKKVLTGNLPYSNFLSESQVIVAILQGTSPAQLDAISGPDAIRALVNDCWTWEPESRPGSKKILEELDQGGFNGVAGEGHEQTVHETLRFRSAMKENEEVPINLNQVEEILDSLCVV